ncbi:hypothetical protein SAY87_005629 [Trapa incisa]|uniref:Uncharacterized protein n=1 Tax=Trapa incisa TaxID=236973 RepID=A0AAN7K671_9MYRT|nr:hypothetical protein SAY87_005629 [Trapa incisa]
MATANLVHEPMIFIITDGSHHLYGAREDMQKTSYYCRFFSNLNGVYICQPPSSSHGSWSMYSLYTVGLGDIYIYAKDKERHCQTRGADEAEISPLLMRDVYNNNSEEQ